MKKHRTIAVILCCVLLFMGGCVIVSNLLRGISGNREEIIYPFQESELDADEDGVDDYTDILEGARSYIATKPIYKSEYYEGGYPNDGCGVCTDVIWQAFAAAGYHLKTLVDADIAQAQEEYDMDRADPNIDFRRVKNLRVFFERNAESLTTSLDNPEEWQGGDIVVFTQHIGIVSDERNMRGVPYLIHHATRLRGAVEADDMEKFTIVGHYRWNG